VIGQTWKNYLCWTEDGINEALMGYRMPFSGLQEGVLYPCFHRDRPYSWTSKGWKRQVRTILSGKDIK